MARYQYKHRRPQRRRIPISILTAVVLLIAAIAYPFAEPLNLSVEEHTYEVAGLAANLKNLRIVFASDIHQCSWFSQKRVNQTIAAINALSPDLIILGGDYATDSETAITFFRQLPSLQARLGVYGVLGNHDRTGPESNLSRLINEMTNAGVTPLVNNVSRIKVGQSSVTVAGVDDIYNGYPDVAGVAAQVYGDDFVIFAGHSPDLLTEMLKVKSADGKNHWYDMALFGHTHGGQINLFGYTPFINVKPQIGARYLTGWMEENRAGM